MINSDVLRDPWVMRSRMAIDHAKHLEQETRAILHTCQQTTRRPTAAAPAEPCPTPAQAALLAGGMTHTPDPPAGRPLDVTISVDHGHAQLMLSGEIDVVNAGQLLISTHSYLDDPHITQVTADLHALTFIDAAGLRTLMLSRRHADQLGKTFVIKNHHGHIAELIGILGLDKYLTDPTHPYT